MFPADPRLPDPESLKTRPYSAAALAHVGDAVYELMIRTRLCAEGLLTAKRMHQATVELVRAGAQARAAYAFLPLLDEEEAEIFRQGRNAEHRHIPSGAQPAEYAMATGLEALFGWLYLSRRPERLSVLFESCWETLRTPEKKT